MAIEPKDSGRAISIHALREEGDQLIYRGATQVALFLSTPSARRATRPLCPVWPRRGISIHALREEGDQSTQAVSSVVLISIHALREEGDDYRLQDNDYSKKLISIHALREEGDVYRCPSGR